MLFLRLQRCRCFSHRHRGNHRKTRTQLVLGNVSRNHCLRCSHDLHVNVWNCPCHLMLYCRGARILSHQDRITLPCGVIRGPQEILAEHVVDIHKVVADYRRSSGVDKYFSSQSPVHKRPSICNWNPGPDEERKMLLRKKMRKSGISLPCKKLLSLWNTKFFMNDFIM